MVQADFAIAQAARSGQPLSVCICDFDRFKSINDTQGHAAGDEILASFGKLVRAGIRTGDIAGPGRSWSGSGNIGRAWNIPRPTAAASP